MKNPSHPGTGGKGGASEVGSGSTVGVKPCGRHHHELDLAENSGGNLAAELRASGISPDLWPRLRYRTVDRQEAEQLTGYRLAGWAVPYVDPDGNPYPSGAPSGDFWRLKPNPGKLKGKDGQKPPKYLTTKEAGNRPYFSPLVDWPRLLRGSKAIDLTEGEKCADSANAHGHPVIGLTGIWGWRDKRSGQSEPLPELTSLEWRGRPVRIVFDSDIARNLDVKDAAEALGIHIAWQKGEKDRRQPQAILLPYELNGEKNGIDDLIARHGIEAYMALLEIPQSLLEWIIPEGAKKAIPIGCLELEPKLTHHKAVMAWAVSKSDFAARTGFGVYKWGGKCWDLKPGKDSEVLGKPIHQWMDHQGWHTRGASVMASVLQELVHRLRRDDTGWDPSHLLAFSNGTLDTNTNEFSLGHCREDLLTFCLPFGYRPAATCPRWHSFLDETLRSNPQLIRLIRAAIRWSVMPKAQDQPFPYEVLFDVIGRKGTGKGTFSEVLIALVGGTSNGAAILKPEGITNPNARHGLIGKRIAYDPDCGGHVRDPGTFNSIVSNEPVEVKRLYHDVFSARLGVVVWRFFNDTPGASGGGVEGMGRRTVTLRFDVTPARRDPHLKPALKSEIEGIFAWAWSMTPADMGDALLNAGSIPTVLEASLDGALEQQPMLRFLLERFANGSEGIIGSAAYRQWIDWCKNEGHAETSNARFGRELKKIGGVVHSRVEAGNLYQIPPITRELLADHLGLAQGPPILNDSQELTDSTRQPDGLADGLNPLYDRDLTGLTGSEAKHVFNQDQAPDQKPEAPIDKVWGPDPSVASAASGSNEKIRQPTRQQPVSQAPNPSSAMSSPKADQGLKTAVPPVGIQTSHELVEQALAELRLAPSHPEARAAVWDHLGGAVARNRVAEILRELTEADRDGPLDLFDLEAQP